jgi:hypothetical protein
LLAQLAAAYDTAAVFQCNAAVSFPLDVSQTARNRALALESVASQRLHATLLADPAIPSIPVPLRLYPAGPTLISQTAEPLHDHPETVADALLWTYSFTCSHRSAAQDQILLTIEFNRPPLAHQDFHVEDGAALRARDEGDSLFKALAQYVAISDALWRILAGLRNSDPDPDADKALLANALDAYADLAERVAGLWSDWWGVGGCDDTPATLERAHPAQHRLAGHSHHSTAPATLRAAAAVCAPAGGARFESYRYLATLDAAPVDGVDLHVTLTLKRLDADGTAEWPEIAVNLEDGTEVPLAPDAPEKDTRAYRFPAGDDATRVPASTVPGFRYRIANLSISAYQNAHAAVSVIRNAALLGAEGPETCPALVYRTPQVRFPDPAVPFIIVGTRLDIGTWTSTVETNPLTAVFGKLFGDDPLGRDMAVDIRYAYPVTGSEAQVDISVPVTLLPHFAYQPSSTVQNIIDALDLWAHREQPVTAGGLWILGITLYSGIDASRELPLLELQSVISPLA